MYYINNMSCLWTEVHEGPFSMDYRERKFHARDAYPTQDTSRMGAARVK